MADNGVEPFIVERVLNHKLEGVMAVYNRAEYENERIKASLAMERIIKAVACGVAVSADVIPINSVGS